MQANTEISGNSPIRNILLKLSRPGSFRVRKAEKALFSESKSHYAIRFQSSSYLHKRNIYILTLLVVFSARSSMAQMVIRPGDGFENLKPGMLMKDILPLLGKVSSVISREDEQRSWEGFGYRTDNKLVFSTNFDKVYVFDKPNPFAVWKIYTSNDTALIYNIAFFGFEKQVTKKISINNAIHFQDSLSQIKKVLGEPVIAVLDERAQDNVTYKNLGLFMILVDKQLTNILLFKAGEAVKPVEPADPCPAGDNLYTFR